MECAALGALLVLKVIDAAAHRGGCELLERIVAMLTKLCRLFSDTTAHGRVAVAVAVAVHVHVHVHVHVKRRRPRPDSPPQLPPQAASFNQEEDRIHSSGVPFFRG